MDIWNWVFDRISSLRENGEHELADMVDRMSGLVCDDKLSEADALYHQALPKVRALDDKWLEIFFRHWRLQGHVLRNNDAKGLLPEAISLLDFAHQDETKGCPQRICAVQDLASCYGIKDSKGFLEERVNVSNETLAQIDGSWPCYECIMGEKIGAMLDSGLMEEAEVSLNEARQELQRHGKNLNDELGISQVDFLLAKGRAEEADKVLSRLNGWGGGEHFRRKKRLVQALVNIQKDDGSAGNDGKESVQPFDPNLATSLQKYWVEAQLLLLEQGRIPNSRALRKDMHQVAVAYAEKGTLRRGVEQCVEVIKLCLSSDELIRGKKAYDLMETMRPDLHKDLGAEATALRLKRELDALETRLSEKSAPTAVDFDGDFNSETAEILAFQAAHRAQPRDANVLLRLCRLWQDCFEDARAYEALEQAYEQARADTLQPYEQAFGEAFLKKHGPAAFLEAFPLSEIHTLDDAALSARCALYIEHFEYGQPEHSAKAAQAWHKRDPGDAEPLETLIRLALSTQDFDAAHGHTKTLAGIMTDKTVAAKRLIETATLAGDTSHIMALGGQLGIKGLKDGLFEKAGRTKINVLVPRNRGADSRVPAIKIGPALCRVTAGFHLEDGLAFGREYAIAFSPEEDSKYSESDRDGNRILRHKSKGLLFDPCYENYRIEGGRPSDEQRKHLITVVKEAGGIYDENNEHLGNLSYPIAGETTEDGHPKYDRVPGLFVTIYATPDTDLRAVMAEITAINKTSDHPLISPYIARAIGDKATIEVHEELHRKYDLY